MAYWFSFPPDLRIASILPRIELIRIARMQHQGGTAYGDSRSSVGLTRIKQFDRVLTFEIIVQLGNLAQGLWKRSAHTVRPVLSLSRHADAKASVLVHEGQDD
jgi:hypothetical protein